MAREEASPTPRTSPPTLHHAPPDPAAGHAPRRAPAASPWALPPFAAPTPEDEDPAAADEPGPAHPSPAGRNPYPGQGTGTRGAPVPIDELADRFTGRARDMTAGPPGDGAGGPARPPGEHPPGQHPPGEPPPGRSGRRTVNRPDRLVASGPPRNPAPPTPPGEPPTPPAAPDTGGGTTWNPLPGEDSPGRASGPGEGAREADIPGGGEPTGSEHRGRSAEGGADRVRPYVRHGHDAGGAGEGGSPYGSGHMRAVWPPEAVAEAAGGEAPAAGADPAPETGEEAQDRTSPDRAADPEPADPVDPVDPAVPVRRVGAPPGGRPARPAVPAEPRRRGRRGPRGGRGRHHRADPGPPRWRGRGLLTPLLVVVVLVAGTGLGFTVMSWLGSPVPTGVRLAAGDGAAADEVFLAPPGAAGSGSSQVLTAVTAVGSTVVAVGGDTTGPVPRPLFLVSTDGGAKWELGQVTGGGEARAGTAGLVTGGGGRWLAAGKEAPASIGARGGGLGLAGPAAAARGMWTSTDGRSWTAVDPARLTMFRPGDRIAGLARTARGFVAVGATAVADGRTGPVAWVSADGQDWTRVAGDDLGAPGGVRALRAVVARGDQVVALADTGADRPAVVLRSADGGRHWRPAAKPLAEVRPEPGALAVAGGGFVLVPVRQPSSGGRVTVYCSPTGDAWRGCGEIGPLGAEGSGVRGLAHSAAGVAAVAETSWQEYTVFTSADGTRWTKGAELGRIPGILRGLAITDQGTLVAGGDGPAGDVDNVPVLLTARRGERARAVPPDEVAGLTRPAREIARLAAAADRFVAVGAAQGDAGAWTSTDGTGWKVAGGDALGGPGRQALADVAHGPAGWLAVGGTMRDPAAARPLLVTSRDGERWRRAEDSDALRAPEGVVHLVPHAVAAGPSGYVIAGEERTGAEGVPVLWFTADLRRYERVAGLPGGGAGVRLHDVAATSAGYLAVGGSGPADRETGVVWVSADGRAWTARPHVLPDGARSAHLRRLLATPDGLVAVGTAVTGDGRRPFAARSTDDGRTWEYSWLPADTAATVIDLAAAGSALVAVGSHGTPGDGAAWISADGGDWRRQTLRDAGLAGEGAQWLGTVAALGDRVVALGRSTTGTEDTLILWRTTVDR